MVAAMAVDRGDLSHSSYPEPAVGTREEAVKAALKSAYRSPGATPINSHAESATGKCLSSRFTSHLEVLSFVQEPYLTPLQIRIVELIYRDDLYIREVANRLNLHHATVSRARHDALETLIRIWWNDPGYSLPYRVYTRSSPALPFED